MLLFPQSVRWEGKGVGRGGGRGVPRHGKGRNDLVAYGKGLDGRAGRVDGADEFVAHDEARGGGLDAAVGVEFPAVVLALLVRGIGEDGQGLAMGGRGVGCLSGCARPDQTRPDRTVAFEKPAWKDHGGTS